MHLSNVKKMSQTVKGHILSEIIFAEEENMFFFTLRFKRLADKRRDERENKFVLVFLGSAAAYPALSPVVQELHRDPYRPPSSSPWTLLTSKHNSELCHMQKFSDDIALEACLGGTRKRNISWSVTSPSEVRRISSSKTLPKQGRWT